MIGCLERFGGARKGQIHVSFFWRQIHPTDRCADNLVILITLGFDFRRHEHSSLVIRSGDLHIEMLAADELTIGNVFLRTTRDTYNAISNRQLFNWDAKANRRELE